MNKNNFSVTVTFNGTEYHFEYGSQAYIFHMGIYNDIPKKYLLDYTALVHSCYIADSNSTPLGKLADYVAKHWRKLKRQNEDDILESFYNETTEENV